MSILSLAAFAVLPYARNFSVRSLGVLTGVALLAVVGTATACSAAAPVCSRPYVLSDVHAVAVAYTVPDVDTSTNRYAWPYANADAAPDQHTETDCPCQDT